MTTPTQGMLRFQVIAWHAEDAVVPDDEDDGDDKTPSSPKRRAYVVVAFGVSEEGRTIGLNLLGYHPRFLVRTDQSPEALRASLSSRREPPPNVSPTRAGRITGQERRPLSTLTLGITRVERKEFWGFTNYRPFKFLQLEFGTVRDMRTVAKSLEGSHQLYESNIDPLLRFCHEHDLDTAGWLQVPLARCDTVDRQLVRTACHTNLAVTHSHVQPAPFSPALSPKLSLCTFDIECYSPTGEFPVASRREREPESRAWVTSWNTCSRLADMVWDLRITQSRPVTEVFGKVKAHIQACGGRVSKEGMLGCIIDETRADTDREVLATRIQPLVHDLKGDPVIQIGLVFRRHDPDTAPERVVLVVGTTAAPPVGADLVIRSFTNEADVLLAMRDEILRRDPDVLLGYNIVGFDMAYLHDRAEELGIKREFLRLGRIAGRPCDFVQRTLSSSALGDNLLRYIDIHGRVVLDVMKIVQRDHKLDSFKLDDVGHHFVGDTKLGLGPADIFRKHNGTPQDRTDIAEYCIQDCMLCDRVCRKLEMLPNNVAMANVCSVPLSYILFRGQGIKIFSLVAKHCLRHDFAIPARPPTGPDDEQYQGAYVLEPTPGLYIDTPVAVLDYASLYPSSMISENLSHDTLVLDPRWDNLPGVTYNRIQYNPNSPPAVFAATTPGVIPQILRHLLQQRKATKKLMQQVRVRLRDGREHVGLLTRGDDGGVTVGPLCCPESEVLDIAPAHDDFHMAVLDGLQLAYKLTANSLYGQMGASTSPLYCKDIAASTTAIGRSMIHMAKAFIEDTVPGARVIYGDTDSVMVSFPIQDARTARPVCGRAAIGPSIALAKSVSARFREHLKPPHDLEYEKTYWPFIIMSKKRYTGNMYTSDDTHHKRVSMGTVSKRRDNPPIVKKLYEALLSKILDEQDVPGSTGLLREWLERMVEGRCDLDDLVITKSLRASYKNPKTIAHKVLADRMARRDPGSAPQTNDRIPYIYVVPPPGAPKKLLQGERIEHADHVRRHNLLPDYEFYITNQLMSPVCKLYSVMLDHLPGVPTTTTATPPEALVKQLLFKAVLERLQRRQAQRVSTHRAQGELQARQQFIGRFYKSAVGP